jgi:hypothetical protein
MDVADMRQAAFAVAAVLAAWTVARAPAWADATQAPQHDTAAAPAGKAAPAHTVHHAVHHTHRARRLHWIGHHAPIPPGPHPAADARPGEEPAPLPNPDSQPPPDPPREGADVSGGTLQMHYPHIGDGFVPGSNHAVLDDNNTPHVPGVTVAVPLHQDIQGNPPP